MRFSLLLIAALSLPVVAEPRPPDITHLSLERPLASSGEVGIPNVVTLVAGETIAEAAAPSPFAGLVTQFLTPVNIASVVVTLLGLVGGALGLSALRKRQIAIVTQHAFHGVEDFAATTENTVDDKVAAGLKIADDWMRAQGWRPLKPDEADVVKLGFTSLNGATKLAEKIQTAAIDGAKPAVLAVPPSAS